MKNYEQTKAGRPNRTLFLVTGTAIMLLAGTVYTWTIIAKSIAATYPSWSAQTLSMTFTISMMGYALGGMTSGMLLKKAGPKPVLAAAAVLFPGGMLLASTAQTPALLYIGFGAMGGFAAGLCYNSTVSTVSAWFPDRQGVASGILLAGFGLSSFIAGKLFAAFAPADGSRLWAAGLRVLAVLLLAVLAAGIAVMRFPNTIQPEAEADAESSEPQPAAESEVGFSSAADTLSATESALSAEVVSSAESALSAETVSSAAPAGPSGDPEETVRRPKKKHREPACDIPTGEMIRKPSFWLFYAWAALLTGAGLLLVSQAGGIAGEVGPELSGNAIATAVGMISILNAAGRICTGTVYDRFGYRTTMFMVMLSFGFSAVMMILAIRTAVFPLLIIGFLAGGFAYGGVASISPPLIADFYGRTWYAANFALIPTNALFTSFASVLAGRIFDRTHSYLGALLLLLGAVALSLILSAAIRRPAEDKVPPA